MQLQVVEGSTYRRQLESLRSERKRDVNTVRGAIADRHGEVLVRHIPCWDVCVHYGVISADKDYLTKLAKRRLAGQSVSPSDDRPEAARDAVRRQIDHMWTILDRAAGPLPADVDRAREKAYRRVERIWRDHGKRSEKPGERVAEQYRYHPVVRGLDRQEMLEVTAQLESYPWVEIRSSSRREYVNAEAFAHVLGRLGKVQPTDKTPERDANFGDDLGAYRDQDTLGRAGAERLFEDVLRGRRGRVIETPDEGETRLDPTWGGDAVLTIDAGMQRAVYTRLREAVEALNRSIPATGPYRPCPGAAAVVLYMPPHESDGTARREALAMVSYPSYEPATYGDDYRELNRETWTLPLRFRAVGEPYAPGSIVKPIVLAAALTESVTTPGALIPCSGHFGKKRCWIANRGMSQHSGAPSVDAELSLARSCNTYYYTMGRRLGTQRLCAWYRAFGLGQKPGLGLGYEEIPGTVPDNGNPLNLCIGQTLTATPVHMANVMATVATGEFVAVTLRHDAEGSPAGPLGVREDHWRVVRNGLRRVVNEKHGTAYRYARLDSETYELCGKTGSAQFAARVINREFTCRLPDGSTEKIIATNEDVLMGRLAARFESTRDIEVVGKRAHRRWPPPHTKIDTHAWFAGYLQPRRSRPGSESRIALAVIFEFAGSGGQVAGPVARDIAEIVISSEHGYVQRNAPALAAGGTPAPGGGG